MPRPFSACPKFLVVILVLTMNNGCSQEHAFKNSELPVAERIEDLLSKLTLEEKTSQMVHNSSGIGRSENATIFSQVIGKAATLDSCPLLRVSKAISDEARAMFNAFHKSKNYNRNETSI